MGGSVVIQTLLADDEVLARQKLRELLRHDSEVEIVGEAASGAEVLELVRATAPQVLFLDVRMPGMDGFDVIRQLSASKNLVMPHVIFSTAYDEYALRAFESRAVDYLLKPYTAERLHAALQKAREQVLITEHRAPRNGAPAEETAGAYPTRIVFKSRGRILFLRVAEIRWIGAEENYVRISTATETHLLRETMSAIEEKLDPQTFLRVHRSAIVNLHFVKEVRTEAQGDFAVLLTNGQKVAMSRSYHSRVRAMLESA
jgi:two-component system LytT family response regulator